MGDSLVFARAVVESCNRLHSLVESKHYHYKEEEYSVYYSISAYGKVSIVVVELFVYDYNHCTGGAVHKEGRHSHRNHILYESEFEFVYASAEVYYALFIGEEIHYPAEREELREHCGRRCSGYAPPEDKYEEGIQYGIVKDCEEGGIHCLFWHSRCAHYGVEPKVLVGYDIAQKYYQHIVPCVGEGVLACPEEEQYGV